ncbi:copper amine oxidase N-terminal domain-containing protein [Bacillus tianshenii]|nr:copper amine oxidase N-terminal domain-containing protein [Bacillus tianshenii]
MNKHIRLGALFGVMLAMAFLFPPSIQAAPASLDGGVIKEGRAYLPMRALFESMGATITWDNQTKTATAYLNNDVVKMGIGEEYLVKNGEKETIDAAAFIHNGHTMMPLRASAEAFGGYVYWDGDNRIAGYELGEKEAIVKFGTANANEGEHAVINEGFLSSLEEGSFQTCPFSMENPPTKGEIIAKYGEPVDKYEGGGGYAMLLSDVSCSPTVAYVNDGDDDPITGIMYYEIPDGMTPSKFVEVVGAQPASAQTTNLNDNFAMVYYSADYAYKAIVSAPGQNETIQGIYIKEN